MIQTSISITDLLESRENIAPLFPLEILATPPARFDLSRRNAVLRAFSPEAIEHLVSETLSRTGFRWGYGGWAEERHPYPMRKTALGAHNTPVFHLGIDIWLPAGTPLFAPMSGTIHSFADDKIRLGYGPVVITKHEIGGVRFHILYGHLSRSSLARLEPGKKVRYGDKIGTVGSSRENGSHAPHVHLQLITDAIDRKADFPGIARPSEKDRLLAFCPDPEVLIRPFLVA